MVLGVLYAWSIFRAPLSGMFPDWTPVDLSWIFTITMLGFLGGGVISGRLLRRIPHRAVVLISAALLFIGFFGASRIGADSGRSLTMMFVFYGIFCGLGIGMPYNAILGAMLKWFPGKEGLVSGVMLMGFGFGGLVLGNAIGMFISSFGVNQTFVILAVGVAAVCSVGSFAIRTPDEAQTQALALLTVKKESPRTETDSGAGSVKEGNRREYTTTEMIRTGAFVILVLWMISGATGGLMVMNSAASIAIFYGSTAGIGLIATVFNGAGRIAFGLVFDRLGSRPSMSLVAAALIASGALMLLGATSGNAALILIGLPLTGLGYGGSPVITSAFVNRYFGSQNYAANLSIANLSVMASSVIGPLLSGNLQEMNGGAFTGTFTAIGILGIVALVLSLFVKSKKS
jgi:OFA family oxalate/formate antiporter-like MFS transporter